MSAFSAPVGDILFSLEHVAGASRLPDWDSDLAREILTQFGRLAEEVFAPLNETGDRQGCRLENGRVLMPDGFDAAYSLYAAQGWPALGAPEDFGGQGAPAPLLGAVTEIFAGANHALQMVVGLTPGAVRTLLDFGSPDQQMNYLPRLASGDWLATMALTEPGAGSDLSGVRTRAEKTPEGWRLHGEKIFISGGDQSLTDRILHLVLARTGAPGDGVRGLSLFLAPSHDDGGDRAPISVLRIEEKLGLHASPTCQLAFDGAPAELLGVEGEGLTAMFTMMNHARLDVAQQGIAHAARACAIARAYAGERRQGRVSGYPGQAPLIAHADVRRMIETAEARALGARALCHIALVLLAEGASPDLLDFLTPVCKLFGTQTGLEAADSAIQTLGGYGYLRDYPVEQIWRDARITAIYEGANGIQALTLAGRLLRQGEGKAATAFEAFVAAHESSAIIAEGLKLWRAARVELASTDPSGAAHAFAQLTATLAHLVAWDRITAAADAYPDREKLDRLARRVERTARAELLYWAQLTRAAVQPQER